MRVAKSEICLDMNCWVEELSPAQLAAYEKVANEHTAIVNALKMALNANEGKELFNGQVFQAYAFKGRVLQELKEAALPKKPPKPVEPPVTTAPGTRGRKRASNFVYLESTDEEEDDMPLAKRIANAAGKRAGAGGKSKSKPSGSGKASPQFPKSSKANAAKSAPIRSEKSSPTANTSTNFRPSEISAVGGLVIGSDLKDNKDSKDTSRESKLQGKTFPSLVVLAKPCLKVKDMSATRAKLDSKVKLVLMLTPNKFTEWLIQEGLLKSEQRCANHRNNELKLGVYSDASKFPYTGGYVWISECCPTRFVSVFHGSIFEAAQHPPSCILKLIYHWSCQTNIQNVVQWVKVDNVYIKGVYTWLRAICTLAVQQKCKKLGGPDKYVEVGVISLGTTSQDGQQRQVKVEVLGVLDYSDKTLRLRAVEPISDADRNYRKRFQTILEPLTRWVHKESIMTIDLTVDKTTLTSMGFKNILQAAPTDVAAKHTNLTIMDYLRRIVPRMFQNTLSLLSRQMIQQFLDELVWREQFGTYAFQAFNNITAHIAEQTRMTTNETLTQRLLQVATNPFKDWSVLPANYKDAPMNNVPKRLKKPINEADYLSPIEKSTKTLKKEKDRISSPLPTHPVGKRRAASAATAAAPIVEEKVKNEKKPSGKATTPAKTANNTAKATPSLARRGVPESKTVKKEDDDLKGLEAMYYGIRDGLEDRFERFPYKPFTGRNFSAALASLPKTVGCPICNGGKSFDSNEKLQTHLVSHVRIDGMNHQFQCLFCLETHATKIMLSKHQQSVHPTVTKANTSSPYHCLICPQRFNSLNYLNSHLQKMHNMLELPYNCQSCGYRSSSHRDAVRHFYDDHKQQNFLQCPFCLDIFRFSFKGQLNVRNIENYYLHLQDHVTCKDAQLKCVKCALSFTTKGALKQHLSNHHVSLMKSTQAVRRLVDNSVLIPVPKVRSRHREPLNFTTQSKFGDIYVFTNGSICLECNSEIIGDDHFIGTFKCNKCNFKTNCERAIFGHTALCSGSTNDEMDTQLPNEMHCVCGFATSIGNVMASHLATCGQKTAYPTMEVALDNTVKRNMLNMLGLMRRDGDSGNVAATEDADLSATTEQQSMQTIDQPPIQFGEMEAAPVVEANSTNASDPQVLSASDQSFEQIVNENADLNAQQPQFHISFGQPEAPAHPLNTSDIDMPLIGELADPNPPVASQFLGEVHTPMFDAVAAAEQQHYHHLQLHPHPQHPQQ